MGFKIQVPWELKEKCKFAMKEMGSPDIRLSKAIWANAKTSLAWDCLENIVRKTVYKTSSTL